MVLCFRDMGLLLSISIETILYVRQFTCMNLPLSDMVILAPGFGIGLSFQVCCDQSRPHKEPMKLRLEHREHFGKSLPHQ